MAEGKHFDMAEEFAGLDFYSIRLEDRFVRTMETLAKQPGASIWEASGNRAEAKAVYRMLGNEDFDREEIIRARREAAIRCMSGYGGPGYHGVNYNTHRKTEGIGYISDKTLGLNVHSRLAATGGGLALGLLDQSSYNRPEPKDETRSHESEKARPIEEEEKEGWRRLETLERSAQDIPEGVKETTVRGREGDRRGLFRKAGTLGQPFLTRTVQKRLAVENKRTLDEPRKKRRRGRVEAIIPRNSLAAFPNGRRCYNHGTLRLR